MAMNDIRTKANGEAYCAALLELGTVAVDEVVLEEELLLEVELAVLLALLVLLDALEAVEVEVVVTEAEVEVEVEVADAEETDEELVSPPLIVNCTL